MSGGGGYMSEGQKDLNGRIRIRVSGAERGESGGGGDEEEMSG
jgi:hypothetical protein